VNEGQTYNFELNFKADKSADRAKQKGFQDF
jgi:hypothetical protein